MNMENEYLERFKSSMSFTNQVYYYLLDCCMSVNQTIKISPQCEEQRNVYINELGWAFFIRIEAQLEALAQRLKITPKDIPKIIEKSNKFTEDEKNIYLGARELRNILHHGDGDHTLLRKEPQHYDVSDLEPTISSEDLDKYALLFIKIAEELVQTQTTR